MSVCCMLRATSRTFLSPDFDRLYGGMPPPYDLALFELPFLWTFCMRDPNFVCLCPVFVVKPVVLMYKKVLRPFSTSSTETQVRHVLGLRAIISPQHAIMGSTLRTVNKCLQVHELNCILNIIGDAVRPSWCSRCAPHPVSHRTLLVFRPLVIDPPVFLAEGSGASHARIAAQWMRVLGVCLIASEMYM